jgi:hypothetical protein
MSCPGQGQELHAWGLVDIGLGASATCDVTVSWCTCMRCSSTPCMLCAAQQTIQHNTNLNAQVGTCAIASIAIQSTHIQYMIRCILLHGQQFAGVINQQGPRRSACGHTGASLDAPSVTDWHDTSPVLSSSGWCTSSATRCPLEAGALEGMGCDTLTSSWTESCTPQRQITAPQHFLCHAPKR